MSKIEFRGSIAAPQNSLMFGRKVGRVTFEIPESEVEKAVGLIALQETPLKITVEIDDEYSQKETGAKTESGDYKNFTF